MPETIALFRLSYARSRWLVWAMSAVAALGVAIALVAGSLEPPSLAGLALFLTLIPPAVSTLLMFDYGFEGHMDDAASGCSEWMLRMPIRSWKIAIVPVILKTAWISAIWVVFVLTCRQLDELSGVHLIQPSIALSAAAIWVLVLWWRPFRSGWRRVVALVILLPTLYLLVAATLAAPQIHQLQWRPIAVIASTFAAVVAYASGVVVCIQSVTYARTAASGIIPASGSADFSSEAAGPARDFRDAPAAIIHHDWIKSSAWVRKIMLVFAVPTIVIATLFVPLNIVGLMMLFVLFADYAAVGSQMGAPADRDSTLPVYLAASPISNATLAWTRIIIPMTNCMMIFSTLLIVFAGWACWPENRAIWAEWAMDRADALGQPENATMIGLRWTVAIVLAAMVLFATQIASIMWVGAAGRKWFTVLITILMSLAVLAPCGVALGWFLQQTDWESTTASALWYLSYAPLVVGGLLLLKSLCVASSWVALVRRQLATHRQIAAAVAIWIGVVAATTTIFSSLIPDPRATAIWCLAATLLLVPLARMLVLPVMIAWNRHR